MQQVNPISRPRHVVWNTAETRLDEQFSYYREAICQAFMNLTPESATTSRFPAKVETIGLGAGAINRVVFPEHTVNRSRADIAASRSIYEWVVALCASLGADRKDLVPFEKYANAAQSLASPSSAARALAAGATNIERVDRLVRTIAAQKGMRSPAVDQIVALVDGWLEANRRKAA